MKKTNVSLIELESGNFVLSQYWYPFSPVKGALPPEQRQYTVAGDVDAPGVCSGRQYIGLDKDMCSSVNRQAEASKPTILVLDDDVLSLELYSRELSSNYRVIACERMEDARQWLKDNLLTAVILEPAMSENDGWLLLSEIHSSPDPLPVIVCSVLDERKVGLEQGADAFLVKPVLPTTLHHLIDQIVSQRKR